MYFYRVEYSHGPVSFINKGKYKTLINNEGKFVEKSLNLTSWNVNGLRAVIRKGNFQSIFSEINPDILMLK